MAAIAAAFQGRKSKLLVCLLLGLLLGALLVGAALVSSLLPLEQWVQSSKAWINGLGAWGFIAFGLAYALAAVLLVPSWPLSIVGGLAFGVWGFVYVPLVATLAASAAFLIGRHLARDKVQKWLAERPQYNAVNRAVADEGWKVVTLLRLSPLVPFNLLNYFCGVAEVSLTAYAAATFVGIIPGTTLYVYLGFIGQAVATGDTLSWVQWALFGVGLLATASVAVVIGRKVKAKLQASGVADAGADAVDCAAGMDPALRESGTLLRSGIRSKAIPLR